MLRSFFPMCCLARSTCFYACLHVYLSFLHVFCFMPCFPMFCSSFCFMLMLGLHANMLVWCCWLWIISMLICVDWCFYMLRLLTSTCFLLSSMCLCTLCHVCVPRPRPRPCLSCHVLLYPFSHFCLSFLRFSLLVQTRSRPYSLCDRPYILAHIKGFGSFIFACLCLLASMLLCLC